MFETFPKKLSSRQDDHFTSHHLYIFCVHNSSHILKNMCRIFKPNLQKLAVYDDHIRSGGNIYV